MGEKKKIIQLFYRYLKNNNAYQSFLSNISKKIPHSYLSITEFLEEEHPDCFIVHAFEWKATKEGYDFWCKEDYYWMLFLENEIWGTKIIS